MPADMCREVLKEDEAQEGPKRRKLESDGTYAGGGASSTTTLKKNDKKNDTYTFIFQTEK